MPGVICDGCQVQGFGPHTCEGSGWVPLVSTPEHPLRYDCTCQVEPGCRSWRPAKAQVPDQRNPATAQDVQGHEVGV